MTKVEYGKSQAWIDTHCSICKRELKPNEDRAKGHCIFNNDEELNFLACIPCANRVGIQIAVKQTKELGMKR